MEIFTKSQLLFNKVLGLFLLGFLLANAGLQAQITIDENAVTDNFGKIIKEVLYETNTDITPQLNQIIAATGPDQTYDFSNLNYVDSTVIIEEFMSIPADDPYKDDPNLAGATFIWKNTVPPVSGGLPDTTYHYRYGSLENGSWIEYGAVSIVDFDSDGMIDTFFQWLSPPSLSVQFPVTANSEWHDSTSLVQEFMGMIFVSSIMLDSNWVEGWGTVITPIGSAPALRIREKSVDMVPNTPIVDVGNDLEFLTAEGHLSASIVLEDGRAFYRKRTVIGGTTNTNDLPKFNFRLQQNYPNPFSESTTIAFTLDKTEKVQLRVIDLNGQVQELLNDKQYSAGNHTMLWSPENLPTGSYFLEMRIGNQVQHRMMNLVR